MCIKPGARFDPIKAQWFNHVYLQARDIKLVAEEFKNELSKLGIDITIEKAEYISEMMRERANFVKEMVTESMFFFKAPEELDAKAIKKWGTEKSVEWINDIIGKFEKMPTFESSTIDEVMNTYVKEKELKAGNFYNTIRICIVGTSKGPHLSKIMEYIGKEETISRLEKGKKYF